MQIQEKFPLRSYNTFGIDVKARYFASFHSVDELSDILGEFPKKPVLVLGGGSNVLFTKDYEGLVLLNEVKGIEELHEDTDHIYVRAGGGVNWHEFVVHCIERGWSGVENLSLIPGDVGAAPMQNIGAYGVELSLVFWNLEAYHLKDRKIHTFTESDCEFGYRESIFKKKFRDQYIIMRVTFRLRKQPIFHTSYGAIRDELVRMGVKELSIAAISQAVINIRRSKLPDPTEIGNAGSFFKNPTVVREKFESLKTKYPDIVGYENISGSVKLAAGWLIEHSGPKNGVSWKGYRKGDAGVHEKQALVLVNHGNATGKEIFKLSEEIRSSVKDKYGVELEREVNVI